MFADVPNWVWMLFSFQFVTLVSVYMVFMNPDVAAKNISTLLKSVSNIHERLNHR